MAFLAAFTACATACHSQAGFTAQGNPLPRTVSLNAIKNMQPAGGGPTPESCTLKRFSTSVVQQQSAADKIRRVERGLAFSRIFDVSFRVIASGLIVSAGIFRRLGLFLCSGFSG